MPVPEEIRLVWKGVMDVREHLRAKKQDFQITKDVKGMQRSTSFSLNRHRRHRTPSVLSESESDTEEIRLDRYVSNDRLSSTNLPSVHLNNSIYSSGSDSETIRVDRSQSDIINAQINALNSLNSLPSANALRVSESPLEPLPALETEYVEFDPDLAKSFKSLHDLERHYSDKLDLLMNLNQPLDITSHELAYQYNTYQLDTRFNIRSSATSQLPAEDDDLPASITETVVQSVKGFLLNTSSLSAEDIEAHLRQCIQSAIDRAQAYIDSIEILKQLKTFPQASRLYLLGVQSALISTPNAATYHSRLSQFSPFTNSLDEIQMADFMANINGVGREYIQKINNSVLEFCSYLKQLCEQCCERLQWRLGSTVLWILSSDFNNSLIYDPFHLKLPAFYQKMLKSLSARIGQDVLITAGPYWDANCMRVPSNEVLARGKDGSLFLTLTGERSEASVFSRSVSTSPTPSDTPTSTPMPRPLSVSSALNSLNALRRSKPSNPPSSVSNASNASSSASSSVHTPCPNEGKRPTDPTYGCFSPAVFALANSLRVSYGLLLIRQFYDHQLKLKQSRPQHANMQNWSLDDVFMVFGYDSPRYYQCTRGMFNEFFSYFQYLLNCFEQRCKAWRPSGMRADADLRRTRHGCFRFVESSSSSMLSPSCSSCSSTPDTQELICPERMDLLVSAGESLLSYYLSLVTWVINTYLGCTIDWQIYGDTIWRLMYASPRLRKLAVVCLQSIVPSTDYLPSMLNDPSLYQFVFSEKEVAKLPSQISSSLLRHRSASNIFFYQDDEDDEEDEETVDSMEDLPSRAVDPSQMSQEEKMQAFVYYLLHLCVHDDFCFGAMTEERLACAQCCPFFPYIYHRLSTEIVEEEDAAGHAVNKRRLLFRNPPSLQPRSLKTRCKMLIRPDGYGASNCNLVVAEEVVYLLRCMLASDRWRELILDIFEMILERAADQIEIEKQKIQGSVRSASRSENEERERIVWYSMGSAVLKVMGSISRRLYAGCRVRVRQQFMDHITDLDVLIQTIHQSSGTGYVIDFNINSGEVLVLLDQMQVPKLFTIYTLDVVDKVPPPAELSNETRDFLITHVQRVIINLEYPDELFELPNEEKDTLTHPFNVVELQNLVLEQNAIYVFHQLMISFPESVRLLSKEFISVLFALALKPSPAKGIFGTEFIRYCFNHLAELLIDTYPGCPHLFPTASSSRPANPSATSSKESAEPTLEVYAPMDPTRLQRARKLQEVLQQPVESIVKALKLFHDNEESTVTFFLEHAVEADRDMEKTMQHIHTEVDCDDTAAIYDFDCPRSSPLFSGQSVRNIIAKKTQVMHSVPFFAQFEPATPANLGNALNVIASRRGPQLDVIYPVDPTGVVVGVQDLRITLSLLDTNSGISRQVEYPCSDVFFHSRRFGNKLSTMADLRRMTARICLNLDLRLLRELVITLLYLFQKEEIDVFSVYDIKAHDLLAFTKLIHVFYLTIASKNVLSGPNHITPASALIYILKQTLARMIQKHDYPQLLAQLMQGGWLQSPIGPIVHPISSKRYYVSSLHPYPTPCKVYERVSIPKAQALRIIFDDRCSLEKDQAFLTFFRDASYSHVISRYTGDFSSFCTLHVQSNTVYYSFESSQRSSAQWGFGFAVEPLVGLSWNNDFQVQGPGCLEWINWQLETVLDIGQDYAIRDSDYFNRVAATIVAYLRTYGAPYKSRAVELLLRLLSEPQLYPVTQLPSIEGIRRNVMRYMNIVKGYKVHPELRLILEMCMMFELYPELQSLKTPCPAENLPPFCESPGDVTLNDDHIALRDVHRLARNLYYGSLPDQSYLRYVAEHTGLEWNATDYAELARTMLRFTQAQDVALMTVFQQRCVATKTSPLQYDIGSFYLTQEDLIRASILDEYSCAELRQRLYLFRLFNFQLSSVIHFIDLMDMDQENRLGTLLCAMSQYINPQTKESVLELSIKETAFDPKESRPVIIVDSMRTYEDGDEPNQRAPILFNESVIKSAFTSQCTFAQLFREVSKIDTNLLRSPLDKKGRLFAIKYKGEQGVDFGGLYREVMERAVEDLFSDRIDLFLPCPNSRAEEGSNEEKYLPNPKYRHSVEAMDMYMFVGNLIGISLRTKQQQAFELPSMIWKVLIGSQPDLEDLESVDTDFITLLKSIRDFDEEEAEESFYDTFGLTFSIYDLAGNENELLPGGAEVRIPAGTHV